MCSIVSQKGKKVEAMEVLKYSSQSSMANSWKRRIVPASCCLRVTDVVRIVSKTSCIIRGKLSQLGI